jgi:hypothetical protein
MAGLYDNDKGVYIEEPCMMHGHWYVDPETNQLFIVPNDDFGSAEIIGQDEEIVERLNVYYRGTSMKDVDTELVESILGLERVPETLFRFSEDIGYFTA